MFGYVSNTAHYVLWAVYFRSKSEHIMFCGRYVCGHTLHIMFCGRYVCRHMLQIMFFGRYIRSHTMNIMFCGGYVWICFKHCTLYFVDGIFSVKKWTHYVLWTIRLRSYTAHNVLWTTCLWLYAAYCVLWTICWQKDSRGGGVGLYIDASTKRPQPVSSCQLNHPLMISSLIDDKFQLK